MDSPELFAAMDDELLLSPGFRLSVESDPGDKVPSRPVPPTTLTLPSLDAADKSLWNLISPCSDADDEVLDEIPIDDDVQRDQSEPETSPRSAVVALDENAKRFGVQEKHDEEERDASSSDEEDEEVEVYNAATAFSTCMAAPTPPLHFRRTSSLDSKAKEGSEALDSVTEGDELDDLEVSSTSSSHLFFDDSTSEDGSVVSSRPSLAAAAGGQWVGRIKAQTYSGSASVKIHQAYDKIRARTLSATTAMRHTSPCPPAEEEDDGGFSSDDEDYDHERAASSTATPTRQSSFSFPTRLTAVKNLSLPAKMPSMRRFRTSSSGTTSSEDSYVGSSHGGSFRGPTADGELASSSSKYNTQELKHKATACASRAAGLLGAASAEAARKLRTSRAFRTSSQPTMSRHAAMAAASPIIDRIDCSPGLPPLPARSVDSSSSTSTRSASSAPLAASTASG